MKINEKVTKLDLTSAGYKHIVGDGEIQIYGKNDDRIIWNTKTFVIINIYKHKGATI